MRLARAIVFVVDLPRMLAFYRDGVGLAVRDEQAGWVELDGVALHAIPAAIAAGLAIEDPPRVRDGAAVKLVFAAPDLAAARARLVAAGARMHELQPWGACDGVDPEGNVLQLVGGGSE